MGKLTISADPNGDDATARARQAAYERGETYIAPPTDVSGNVAPSANPAGSFSSNTISDEEWDREMFIQENSYKNRPISHGSVNFPWDLGQAHLPDYMSFLFLDLVTKDGDKEVFASEKSKFNAGQRYTTDASKKSSNGGLSSERAPIGEALLKPLNAGIDKVTITSAPGEFINGILPAETAAGVKASATEFLTPATYALTGDAVHIMMPAAVEFSSSAGWQAVDATPSMLGMLADIALTDTKFGDVAKFEINKWVQGVLYENGAGMASATVKKNINPYVSQAFEAMQRRQFRFTWLLTPKNLEELKSVETIIRLFRWHMHPLIEDSEAFLRFPSQVDIKFNVPGGENKWLPKIATCVIKSFETNYTPNNQWSTSNAGDGNEGAPYQFQISVVVEEVVPLVKTDILRGY